MSKTKKLRWCQSTSEEKPSPKIDAFVDEVIEVCKKHGFTIGHEDSQGAFVIHRREPDVYDDLNYAFAWVAE